MPAGSGVPDVPDVPEDHGTGGTNGDEGSNDNEGTRNKVPAATPAFTPEEQASLDAWDQEMQAYAPYSDIEVGALAQMLPYACEVLGAQGIVESAWERLHIEARLVAASAHSDRAAYVDAMDDFVCTAGTELTEWARGHGLGKLRIPCAVYLGPTGSVFMPLVLNDGDKRPYILRRTSGPDASGVPAT